MKRSVQMGALAFFVVFVVGGLSSGRAQDQRSEPGGAVTQPDQGSAAASSVTR